MTSMVIWLKFNLFHWLHIFGYKFYQHHKVLSTYCCMYVVCWQQCTNSATLQGNRQTDKQTEKQRNKQSNKVQNLLLRFSKCCHHCLRCLHLVWFWRKVSFKLVFHPHPQRLTNISKTITILIWKNTDIGDRPATLLVSREQLFHKLAFCLDWFEFRHFGKHLCGGVSVPRRPTPTLEPFHIGETVPVCNREVRSVNPSNWRRARLPLDDGPVGKVGRGASSNRLFISSLGWTWESFKLCHLKTLSSSSNNRIVPEKGFHRCQSFHCHTPRRHPGEYTCIMMLRYLYIWIVLLTAGIQDWCNM